MSRAHAPTGAFGKLPSDGEFIRMNVTAASAHALEHLVGSAMAHSAEHGSRFQTAFDEGAMYGFLFRQPAADGDLTVGVILPSRDAAGRRYPFVVLSTLPEEAFQEAPHLAPLCVGEFLTAATDVAYAAYADGNAQVGALLSRLEGPAIPSLHRYAEDYELWARRTQVSHAMAMTFGDGFRNRAGGALLTVVQCLEPWSGLEHPATRLAVRLPIHAAGVSVVAFWTDVVRRVARWHHTTPSLFWNWDGEVGEILLFLGEVDPVSLVELWAPDEESEHVCDLTRPGRSADGGVLPPAVANVLHSADATVAELLAALGGG